MMSKKLIKKRIKDLVEENQGMKLTELVVKLSYLISLKEDILLLIEEMVEKKDLIEIEYVLKDSDRLKSFILPRGTRVLIDERQIL